jgi:hypothetical protein
MQDDKKKLIVVVALAVVILAVGVFQFTSGGSQPAPITSKKDEKKVVPEEQPEPLKNPMFAADLRPRDPFKEPASIAAAQTKPNVPQAPVGKINPPSQMPDVTFDKTGSFGQAGPLGPVGPVVVEPPVPQFGYRLSGVMLGAKPMAVFTDLQGNQRLILLGGALDPESKVLSITKDAVEVMFHGKTLRLTVEGNPNDK